MTVVSSRCCCGGECFRIGSPCAMEGCEDFEGTVNVPEAWPAVPAPDLVFMTTGAGDGNPAGDCCADVDSSGTVDINDYIQMLHDGDGVIDEVELSTLLLQWGWTSAQCAANQTCPGDGDFDLEVEAAYLPGRCRSEYKIYASALPSSAEVMMVLGAAIEDGAGVPLPFIPALGSIGYADLQLLGDGGSWHAKSIGQSASPANGRVLIATVITEHCDDIAGTFTLAWRVGEDIYRAQCSFTIDAPQCKTISRSQCHSVRVPCGLVKGDSFRHAGICYQVSQGSGDYPLLEPTSWHPSCGSCCRGTDKCALIPDCGAVLALVRAFHVCESGTEGSVQYRITYTISVALQVAILGDAFIAPAGLLSAGTRHSKRLDVEPFKETVTPIGPVILACCNDGQWRVFVTVKGEEHHGMGQKTGVFERQAGPGGCPISGTYTSVGSHSGIGVHCSPNFTGSDICSGPPGPPLDSVSVTLIYA